MKPLDYLKRIEEHGFSCYIVGGYTRDKVLGIDSTDIDIATSARPKDISEIFEVSVTENLGCINIKDGDLNIDITTYRKESFYQDRHPHRVEYIDDIEKDLKRRDFTINAICLSSDGSIYDPLEGIKDLSSGIIRVIGDIDSKFREDPLRMLRALRLSIIYDFTIEKSALDYIIENKMMLKTLSYDRKRKEIDKILLSGKTAKGLKYLDNLGLLDILDIGFLEEYHEVNDLIGSWAQLKCDRYRFSKLESTRLEHIRTILKLGTIDMNTLYLYDLYDNIVAGEIMEVPKNYILTLYKEMPIKNERDLALNGKDIMDLLNKKSGPLIKQVKEDLLRQIFKGKLVNTKLDLSNYICENWK